MEGVNGTADMWYIVAQELQKSLDWKGVEDE